MADNVTEVDGLRPRTLRLFAIVLSIYEFVSSLKSTFVRIT